MTKFMYALWFKIACIFVVILTGLGSFLSLGGILIAGETGVFSNNPKSYYNTPLCESTTYDYAQQVIQWYQDGVDTEDIANTFSNGNTNFSFALYDMHNQLVGQSTIPEQVGTKISYPFYFYELRNEDGSYSYFENAMQFTIVCYVAEPLQAADNYWFTYRIYDAILTLGYGLFILAFINVILFALSFIYLICAAGHRNNTNEIVLNVQDKIPLDLYILLQFSISSFVLGLFTYKRMYMDMGGILLTIFCIVLLEILLLAAVLTFSTRLKKGRWWENAICFRIWKFFFLFAKAIFSTILDAIHALPMTWKAIVTWLVLSSIYLVASRGDGLVLFLNTILLIVIACISAQWQALSRAGTQLSKGNLEYQVNTKRMFRAFRLHGENLNHISQGAAIAMEQKMKSERLRTELITNVSHDIKTPLTSIINYVDLLKKEDLQGKATEYIDVLDRQSRRLKKLTDDLVEASKASTGNIHCQLMPTDMIELVQQAVAEYEEKLEMAQLTPIIHTPEDAPIYALADGNLMWRVLSNLLSNACKYAQPCTRVYIQLRQGDEDVWITMKNVSRDQLNVDPDELMERFVRGDSSRSTEGSGLGLNIARSLVELQKGTFTLSIDGDLFKAQIRCTRVAPPAPPEPPASSMSSESHTATENMQDTISETQSDTQNVSPEI